MNDVKKATILRILSAAIALPVYVFTIVTDMFNCIPILVCSLIISLLCLYEFYRMSDRGDEGRPFIAAGITAGFILNLVMYYYACGKSFGYSCGLPAFDARAAFALIVLAVGAILAAQIFIRPINGGIYSVAVTLFGLVFIVLSFSHIILMKSLTNGAYYIIVLNAAVMLCDSGAYFGGVFFGRHKANIAVSPNKTWEGYISGALFSVVGMIIANQVFDTFFNARLFSVVEAAVLGFAICVLTAIGDLSESAVKRDAGVKDSGTIIPGHGGMWDAFDAVLFNLPFFYYYLVIKGVV
ncbi:MAG: phosphatidate cytidylyltransferase [Spirochaetes bacterium]|jgi:phosphatidate cytidylyltransferase|nr:phosphatidate cytidylyltransferase [Spirochaetota bacterium]